MTRKKQEEQGIIYESHNDSFSKSNSIIISKYKASLMEQKLLNIVLARLQQKQYIDCGETGGLVVVVKAKELKKMMGSNSGSFYEQLKPAAEAMTSRTIGFVNDDIEAFKYVSLISSATYIDAELTVKFNHELKKYLTPQTQFTVLELDTLLHYKNIYALRLHEILLSRCYKQKKFGAAKLVAKETDGQHFKIDFNLSELKLSLGVVNAETASVKKILSGSKAPDYDKAVEKASEKSFNTWYEMRRQVIDVAIKEINQSDNGIQVSYEPIKAGRGGKVYGVSFYVDLTNNTKKKEEVEPVKELSKDEKFEVQCNVREMLASLETGQTIKIKDVTAVCEAANYDIAKIQAAYDVAKGYEVLTNPVGFLIKAIQEGYHMPGQNNKKLSNNAQAKSRNNAFNNFTGRAYDWADLERQLLGTR